MPDATELRAQLRARLAEITRRTQRIEDHLQQKDGALSPDWQEQAAELENDEVLEALDERGRQEIDALLGALARLDAGEYGQCAQCGEAISEGRLRVLPTTTLCVRCAA